MSPLVLGAAELSMALLSLALLLAAMRLLRGPSIQDRLLALDPLYVDVIALLVVIGVRFSEPTFFDGALVIALLGFIGTVALAKFQLRGDIVD